MKAAVERLARYVRTRMAQKPIPGPDVEFGGVIGAPNVLIFSEHINATYFISFDIPLRGMHAKGEINFAAFSQASARRPGPGGWLDWSDRHVPDVVVLTRYGQEDGLQILEHFQRKGIRVIYHIDDDLLHIPESLGADIQARHGAESVIRTRKELLRLCDTIYASTPHLAGLLQTRFPGQTVVHGMYAPYMGSFISAPVRSARAAEGPIVGYMGSRGHAHDLELAVPAIERLLDERTELRFEVFGTIAMPARLARFGDRVRSHAVNRSYADFLGVLASLEWSVGLAPLEDAPFNHCKAPTKFIEYTAAGIPVVASRTPVYGLVIPERGGVLVEAGGWYDAIAQMLETSDAREMVDNSRAFCAREFSVERLQHQLEDIFKLS